MDCATIAPNRGRLLPGAGAIVAQSNEYQSPTKSGQVVTPAFSVSGKAQAKYQSPTKSGQVVTQKVREAGKRPKSINPLPNRGRLLLHPLYYVLVIDVSIPYQIGAGCYVDFPVNGSIELCINPLPNEISRKFNHLILKQFFITDFITQTKFCQPIKSLGN